MNEGKKIGWNKELSGWMLMLGWVILAVISIIVTVSIAMS